MRDGEKEYELAKDAAASIGCHLPESHIFHSTVANTPAFIREYFFLKGWEAHREECDAVHAVRETGGKDEIN